MLNKSEDSGVSTSECSLAYQSHSFHILHSSRSIFCQLTEQTVLYKSVLCCKTHHGDIYIRVVFYWKCYSVAVVPLPPTPSCHLQLKHPSKIPYKSRTGKRDGTSFGLVCSYLKLILVVLYLNPRKVNKQCVNSTLPFNPTRS